VFEEGFWAWGEEKSIQKAGKDSANCPKALSQEGDLFYNKKYNGGGNFSEGPMSKKVLVGM